MARDSRSTYRAAVRSLLADARKHGDSGLRAFNHRRLLQWSAGEPLEPDPYGPPDDRPFDVVTAFGRLDILASAESVMATGEVLHDAAGGWHRMMTAAAWDVVGSRARIAWRDTAPKGRPPILRHNAALSLCWYMSLGRDDDARWLADAMVRDRTERYFAPLFGEPLAGYALALATRLYLLDYPTSLPPDAARSYGRLFQLLDTRDDAIARNLVGAACEHHMKAIREDDDFCWKPFTVYPVEILALRRLLRRVGRDLPQASHPLLQSPLCEDPPVDTARDELAERFLARVRQELAATP